MTPLSNWHNWNWTLDPVDITWHNVTKCGHNDGLSALLFCLLFFMVTGYGLQVALYREHGVWC